MVKEFSAYSLYSLLTPSPEKSDVVFETLQVREKCLAKVEKESPELLPNKKKSKKELFLSASAFLLFLV